MPDQRRGLVLRLPVSVSGQWPCAAFAAVPAQEDCWQAGFPKPQDGLIRRRSGDLGSEMLQAVLLLAMTSSMIDLAARNAASIDISDVSSKCASAAGLSGESARPMSRSSRRTISARISASSAWPPRDSMSRKPPPGAHLRARRDIELHVGVGADHGADVAAVEHGAAGLCGEGALLVDQDFPHLREHRDPRGRVGHRVRRQRVLVEIGQVDLARRGLGRRFIVERQAVRQQRMADGAVGQARCRAGAGGSNRQAAAPACPCRRPPGRRWRW